MTRRKYKRCISIQGKTYLPLREEAIRQGKSIHSIVDKLVTDHLDKLEANKR